MNEIAKAEALRLCSQTGSTTVGANALKAPEPFVDAEEAGRFLSLRPRRVLELARKGILPGHPLGTTGYDGSKVPDQIARSL
jgi:hypothetical protein